MNEKNEPKKIIIHHSADASFAEQFWKINEYHRSKEFPKSNLGFFAGYHYVIERSGHVVQARQPDEIGAHTIGQNKQSVGIGLAGNFDHQRPTANQIVSLCKLIDYLTKTWQIPGNAIYPHRKFQPTTCYGLILNDDWARNEYINYLSENLKHLLTILKAYLEKLLQHVKKK